MKMNLQPILDTITKMIDVLNYKTVWCRQQGFPHNYFLYPFFLESPISRYYTKRTYPHMQSPTRAEVEQITP